MGCKIEMVGGGDGTFKLGRHLSLLAICNYVRGHGKGMSLEMFQMVREMLQGGMICCVT